MQQDGAVQGQILEANKKKAASLDDAGHSIIAIQTFGDRAGLRY